MDKYQFSARHAIESGIIFVNCLLIVLVITIGECIHRKNLRTPVALKTAKDIVPSLTLEEFNIEIESGSKLVILDNLVLDITDFINEHPGGRFVL